MELNFFRLYNHKLGGKIRTTQKESSRSDLRAPNNDRLKFYAQNLTEIFNWILEARRFENALCLRIFFLIMPVFYLETKINYEDFGIKTLKFRVVINEI